MSSETGFKLALLDFSIPVCCSLCSEMTQSQLWAVGAFVWQALSHWHGGCSSNYPWWKIATHVSINRLFYTQTFTELVQNKSDSS